jgi:hypothetical protein
MLARMRQRRRGSSYIPGLSQQVLKRLGDASADAWTLSSAGLQQYSPN